jgi:hypothetical protein
MSHGAIYAVAFDIKLRKLEDNLPNWWIIEND